MTKIPIFKFINFYFFKLSEKFAEKQTTKSFLINKNNVTLSVDIF